MSEHCNKCGYDIAVKIDGTKECGCKPEKFDKNNPPEVNPILKSIFELVQELNPKPNDPYCINDDINKMCADEGKWWADKNERIARAVYDFMAGIGAQNMVEIDREYLNSLLENIKELTPDIRKRMVDGIVAFQPIKIIDLRKKNADTEKDSREHA